MGVGVIVGEGVIVGVEVSVGVRVGVKVGVDVGVEVAVAVAVLVGVAVEVFVAVGVGLENKFPQPAKKKASRVSNNSSVCVRQKLLVFPSSSCCRLENFILNFMWYLYLF